MAPGKARPRPLPEGAPQRGLAVPCLRWRLLHLRFDTLLPKVTTAQGAMAESRPCIRPPRGAPCQLVAAPAGGPLTRGCGKMTSYMWVLSPL